MKPAALVLVVVLLAACAPSGPGGDNEPVSAAATVGVHCGYERWAVKTGTDPAAGRVNLHPQTATLGALDRLRSPLPPVKGKYPPQTPRQPSEEQTVTVAATLVRYALQQDGDLHLVLRAGKATLIAEIPNPVCVHGGPFAAGITAARAAFVARTGYNPPPVPAGSYAPTFVNANLPVVVTGVRFFDFVHGQSGVAGNGVEVHPVTAITFH